MRDAGTGALYVELFPEPEPLPEPDPLPLPEPLPDPELFPVPELPLGLLTAGLLSPRPHPSSRGPADTRAAPPARRTPRRDNSLCCSKDSDMTVLLFFLQASIFSAHKGGSPDWTIRTHLPCARSSERCRMGRSACSSDTAHSSSASTLLPRSSRSGTRCRIARRH